MLLRLKIESNKISSIFFFLYSRYLKKKTKDPIDFDEKEMSMGAKKKKNRSERYEDKRWKYSCVAIKSIPTWKWMRKKNGWDRNFESREDVYK